MVEKIAWVMAACLLILSVSMIYKTWALGSDEDDYGVICIGGHEYWRANFTVKGFLAVKLNNDGTPVKCE